MVSLFSLFGMVIWGSLVHSVALSSGLYSRTIEAGAYVVGAVELR